MRIVRLRPGLIFKREAATGIRRLFAGPFLPGALLRQELIPVVPDVPRLRFQAVHSLDVGEAYRLAVVGDAAGLQRRRGARHRPRGLGELLGARRVPVRGGVLRTAADLTWKLRLQPAPPAGSTSPWACRSWTSRGRGPSWAGRRATAPRRAARAAGGLRDGADYPTPPLASGTGGPARLREVLTGIGGR